MNPLIVNVALTGCVFSQSDYPALPVSPQEVAEDARRCYAEGATVFHVHARDYGGLPTWKAAYYSEYVELLRHYLPDAVLCVSTSGRHWQEFWMRSNVLLVDGIDMASLTLGSFNFPSGPSVNSIETIEALARAMLDQGIKPEFEVFDVGQASYGCKLIERLEIPGPHYANLFFGNVGTMQWSSFLFRHIQGLLPDTVFAGAGVGRHQEIANEYAVRSGNHVRVGMEDNPKGGSNVEQVKRIVAYARQYDRAPATIQQTRELLCLE